MLQLAVFFKNSIVELEKWLTASIIRVGEVWELSCELQNKLQKALLFITKDYRPSGSVQICRKKKQRKISHFNFL